MKVALALFLLILSSTVFSQPKVKCYKASTDEGTVFIYFTIDSSAVNGDVILVKDNSNDSLKVHFTGTASRDYVYPKYTADIEVNKGTTFTTDPWKMITLAGVKTLRVNLVKVKRSTRTNTTWIMAACDE
jgi:hypothetical protein